MATSRQKRKRRRRAEAPAGGAGPDAAGGGASTAPGPASDGAGSDGPASDGAGAPPPLSRSERRNAEVRAGLVPLGPGERPLVVTIGAVMAALLGLSNVGLYAAGFEVSGERPDIVGVLAFTALMLTAAWGMWQARYWAVLGWQALLGLLIVIFSLALVTASDIWGVLLMLALILPAGTMFWFMVKAMARIQMPTRDQ